MSKISAERHGKKQSTTPRQLQNRSPAGTWPQKQRREELAEFLNELSDDSVEERTQQKAVRLGKSQKVPAGKQPTIEYKNYNDGSALVCSSATFEGEGGL